MENAVYAPPFSGIEGALSGAPLFFRPERIFGFPLTAPSEDAIMNRMRRRVLS